MSKFKQISNLKFGDGEYQFNKPLVINVMDTFSFVPATSCRYLVVVQYYDCFFVGTGNTPEAAVQSWYHKFHYYYQQINCGNLEAGELTTLETEDLMTLFKKDVNEDAYKQSLELLVKKEGVITRYENGKPAAYRWIGSENEYPVCAEVQYDLNFEHLTQGDSFTTIAQYDKNTYQLQRFVYSERVLSHQYYRIQPQANGTIIHKRSGIVVAGRLNDLEECPCSVRWDYFEEAESLPDLEYVDKGFASLKTGDCFTSIVELNPSDYTLKRILYTEKDSMSNGGKRGFVVEHYN